jgi:hypothetical protein
MVVFIERPTPLGGDVADDVAGKRRLDASTATASAPEL